MEFIVIATKSTAHDAFIQKRKLEFIISIDNNYQYWWKLKKLPDDAKVLLLTLQRIEFIINEVIGAKVWCANIQHEYLRYLVTNRIQRHAMEGVSMILF